jgi:uncharacterized repeat protein (TIGR02543 family)
MKGIKNLTLKLLAAICAACLIFGAMVFGATAAKADGETMPTGATVTVDDGVSLKLNDKGGMRFIVRMNSAAKKYIVDDDADNVVKLVVVIAPTQIFADKNLAEDFVTLKNTCPSVEIDESKIYADGEDFLANACVVSMKPANRNLAYTAVAFVVKDNAVVTNTALNAKAQFGFYDLVTRSILITADGEDYSEDILTLQSYEWFGSKEYPVRIETVADYNALVSKINLGRDFGVRNIEVKASLDLSGATEIEEGKKPQNLKFVSKITCVVDGKSTVVSVEKGNDAGLTAPTKAADEEYSYKFVGWMTEENGTTQADLSNVTADMTVYAKFKAYAHNSVSGLTVADIKCGETPAPTATAAHGTVTYKYATAEDGEYTEITAFRSGVYYVKAFVEEGDDYEGAESPAVSFRVSHNFNANGKCACGEYNTQGVKYGYDAANKVYYVDNNKDLSVAEVTVLPAYNDGTNGEYAVTFIRNGAFMDNGNIVNVILPDSIKQLDGSVFQGCANLKYVSMTGITDMAFKNLGKNGIYANEPENVITNNNFLNCVKLTTVIVNKSFNLYKDSDTAQQFKFTRNDITLTPCVDIYVVGTQDESNVNCARITQNDLLSGVIYYKGDKTKCLQWNFDDNGDVVHGNSAHEFEDGKCVHCGEYNTQGVVYGYDEGNDCYYVEDNRKLNVSEITVLSLYNDGEHGEKAVKYMRHEAFAENPFITKIILPDSVDDLDGSVFRGCENLVYVSMTGVKTWNYKETVRPYGNRDGNNNFLNCTKLQFVIISDALSTNVQQFFSTGTVETPILDFYVNGASGAPKFTDVTKQNLWTGTVYFKGDASKCLQWNFDSDGNISHGNAKHNFVDGKCSGCGIYNTQGVKYGYDATNKVYYVDKQETTFNVAEVNILPLYDDGTNGEHNVTFVRIGAFSGNAAIKKVILPASITRLDGSVFADCINLEYVSMIGVTNLESKAISGGIYGDESDYTTNNFLDCEKLTTVIVDKSFTAGVQQFKSRSDSSSVCVNIYAVGSAEEVSVNISNEQNQLYGGTVYYYSETEAAGCWHYVDGVATLWA